MKRTILAIAAIALLALGGQAFAEICAVDNVPAASLLLPYFEVDVSDAGCADPFATTTFFAVNNASDTPIVAHATVWTDRSVPALDFDIFLTGYDVQTVNVKDFFCSGNLPVTANNGMNPRSPIGPFSNPTNPFPGAFVGNGRTVACDASSTVGTGLPPNYANPAISTNFRNHLKAWFTGLASPIVPGNQCAGSDRGNEIAVGYVTVDAAYQCSVLFPADPDYFDDADRIVSNDNVLWGDYQYVNVNEGRSEGFALVHLEADDQLLNNGPTFYGRYTWDEAAPDTFGDRREPLPTTWAARYNTNDAVDLATFFQIWREGPEQLSWTCTTPPPGIGFSGGLNSLLAFNELEEPSVPPETGGPSGEPEEIIPVSIPYEAQRFQVGDINHLPSMFDNGWYYLNLQNDDVPATSLSLGQAYLTVSQQLPQAGGLFSGGWDGISLDGQCATGIVPVPATPTTVNPGPFVASP